MGVAIGNIGMLVSEFLDMDMDEFRAVYQAWNEREEMREQSAWERTRILATMCVQPYSKKRLSPKDVLPLPWDKERKKSVSEVVSKEEAKKRLIALLEKTRGRI